MKNVMYIMDEIFHASIYFLYFSNNLETTCFDIENLEAWVVYNTITPFVVFTQWVFAYSCECARESID